MPRKRTVLAVVDELFFQAKISGAAAGLGVAVRFVSRAEQLAPTVAAVTAAGGADELGLLLLDLNLGGGDGQTGLTLLRAIRADELLRDVPTVAYLSHVQTDLRRSAEAIGAERVWPRSKLNEQLAPLLIEHCGGRLPTQEVPSREAAALEAIAPEAIAPEAIAPEAIAREAAAPEAAAPEAAAQEAGDVG